MLVLRVLSMRAVLTAVGRNTASATCNTAVQNPEYSCTGGIHNIEPRISASPEVSAILLNLEKIGVLAVSAVQNPKHCEYTKHFQYYLSAKLCFIPQVPGVSEQYTRSRSRNWLLILNPDWFRCVWLVFPPTCSTLCRLLAPLRTTT